jgi:phosphoserine phosphatase RsbU/P
VASAGLPVFVWDGTAVRELKGDPRRVGYRSPGNGQPWATHRVPAVAGTTLYLCTDGFLDQAGGEKGFGFGRERFAGLVGRGARLAWGEQEAVFRDALAGYQGVRAQRDDITVLAFRAEGGTGR